MHLLKSGRKVGLYAFLEDIFLQLVNPKIYQQWIDAGS
jgi:hypothetical protein